MAKSRHDASEEQTGSAEHRQSGEHAGGGMGMRGVSRPMHESHDHGMSDSQRSEMLRMHHQQTLWVYWTILLVGVWVLLSPVTFGYGKAMVVPSGERGVWFSSLTHDELRATLMTFSDVASGLLLLVFGWRALRPNRPVSLWVCCFVGVWLNVAPVLFWAPTAAAYLNGTIAGALLIALTILIPGMPNMIMYMQMGPPTPPGWSYNPSSWPQRWIMIVTGFAGWIVSRYLAAFQLGYIDQIWEPFFGQGTRQVLNSDMSHMWPISDASLGALAYTFEFLMGYMGSPARWRTMPWMVAFFGILVIPLGLTHIVLVISQPVVVGHWCTLCLLAAAIMLPMIPLEVDEVVAMGQHMIDAKRRGDRGGSLWTIFWKGGQADDCTADERSPELMQLPERPGRVFVASIWGMSFPWTLIATSAIGIWLMFAPTVFALQQSTETFDAADVMHLGGALILTTAVIAMGEVLRLGRFLNVVLALLVIGLPWLLTGGDTASHINNAVCGIAVILLSIPRGPKQEMYGRWDRFVR
ncbi:MAG: vitamin K epoxide reductase family protein [Planctomycetales bacterium]|nr:vitamin K epoxide reductase family protein [Planctomycetales bacterium]